MTIAAQDKISVCMFILSSVVFHPLILGTGTQTYEFLRTQDAEKVLERLHSSLG